MVLTFENMEKVAFPVFKLPSSNWELTDGLLWCDGLLLDDKNMPGNTLGARRLQSPWKNQVELKKSIPSLIGILKQSSGRNGYIDSKGRPFLYQKTLMCQLRFFKIKEVMLKESASVLKVQGIPTLFTIPRPPPARARYAGILYLRSYPWLLYEYSEVDRKNTLRKV